MMLRIATCQFPVGNNVSQNAAVITRQMKRAAEQDAHLVLFSESALSGYVGLNFPSFRNYDWYALERATCDIMNLARELGLWVILGSSHRLTGRNKPHNSLYIINDKGRIAHRYDKRICTGTAREEELKHFTPGTDPVVVSIRGVKCGFLICHEWRYPELYREYKQLGVRIMLQSWYDGGLSDREYERAGRAFGDTLRATAIGHAVCNAFWLVGSNTSKPQSCFGSFVVHPEGRIVAQSTRNRPHVLVHDVDPNIKVNDPAHHWRKRVMTGVHHSGTPVTNDPRSDDHTCLE